MKSKGLSRRDFLKTSTGAAAGMLTASLLGCSGSGNSGDGGNTQSQTSQQPWSFHRQQGIFAAYRPSNTALYRNLLPSVFQMPDSLMLLIAIAYYGNVTAPLTPYREFYAVLSCKYQGQTGLYTLTMPVTDKAANDGGNNIGFPKYIADRIDLVLNNGIWTGEVMHNGRSLVKMSFTPSGQGSTVRRTNPGPSFINLLPPTIGPRVVIVNVEGTQAVTSTAGSAVVSVDDSQGWGQLLNGADLISTGLEEITGDWTFATGPEITSGIVSIVKITNGRIDLAVQEAINLLVGIDAVTEGKQKIMLKPNLVNDQPSATTKPEIVGALARLMLAAGKDVSIGEGSAVSNNYNLINGVTYRTKDRARLDAMQQHIYDTLGYSSLARTLGIPLVNLHSGTMTSVPIPNGFVYSDITIHSSLTETDLLCSIPIMKTHVMGGVTLGMKNLIGTYPGTVYGSVRSLVHDEAVKCEGSAVAAAVVDIVRANKLGLVVVDASIAMEGNGPTDGSPVQMNLIIAGTNPLATDMVAANVMGFDPTEIPTFQWANRAGLVPVSLAGIEVRGESIQSVQRRFVRPNILPWTSVRPTFGALEI